MQAMIIPFVNCHKVALNFAHPKFEFDFYWFAAVLCRIVCTTDDKAIKFFYVSICSF